MSLLALFFYNMTEVDVYNIFKGYFGEDKVDLTPSSIGNSKEIIVYYPNLTITNENQDSITVKDLFVRVIVTNTGKLYSRFQTKKATYIMKEWCCGYIHSHTERLYNKDNVDMWSDVCTGTGPINNTMDKLKTNPDEITWELFVIELDNYYHVESLSGGPYIRMQYVFDSSENQGIQKVTTFKDYNLTNGCYRTCKLLFHKLLTLLIQSNKLKFVVQDGSIALGNDPIEFANLVMKEFNEHKLEFGSEVRHSTIIAEGFIFPTHIEYYASHSRIEIDEDLFDTNVIVFKGKEFKLKISDYNKREIGQRNKILSANALAILYFLIINLVNIVYGNYKEGIAPNQAGIYF